MVNIESFAFASDNALKKIVIPSTVINIGKSTFRTYKNFVRRDIIMRPTIPPTLGATAFYDLNDGVHRLNPNLLIWVPYSQDHSVLNDYKSATNWITYASYIMELDANGNIPE